MLHVELTARIYILLARIFISVRGRLTSSMTGGRDAWCLAWLCLTAFLRTSLRRATARDDAKAKGTRRLTMLSHRCGTALRSDATSWISSASPTHFSPAPRRVNGGSAPRSLPHFPLSCNRDAEICKMRLWIFASASAVYDSQIVVARCVVRIGNSPFIFPHYFFMGEKIYFSPFPKCLANVMLPCIDLYNI